MAEEKVLVSIYSILPISFQVAGGVILLLWSFNGKLKEKAIRMYFPGSNIAERDKDKNVVLNKGKLRKNVTELIKNRVAFIYLVIGYIAQIAISYDESLKISVLKRITILSIEVVLLLFLGFAISCLIARYIFKEDMKTPYEKLISMNIGVDTNVTTDEIDDMFAEAKKAVYGESDNKKV